MKISKYTALIKRRHYGLVVHTPEGIYLGTDGSIYKAEGIPDMNGLAQIGAVLDIEPKKMEKIIIRDESATGKHNICGLNLQDEPLGSDQDTERLETVAAVGDSIYSTLVCADGEMIFYDENLLSPLADKLNNEDRKPYISYVARSSEKRGKYIVIKDGLETLGAIMPVKVLSEEYISKLRDFHQMCLTQFQREKAEWAPQKKNRKYPGGNRRGQ